MDNLLFKKPCSHPRSLIVSIMKAILSHFLLFEAPRLLGLSNIKDWPLLATILITNESDGDMRTVWLLARHLVCCQPSIWRGPAKQVRYHVNSDTSCWLTVQIGLLHPHSDSSWADTSQVFLLSSATLFSLLQDLQMLLPHVAESPWDYTWLIC